MRPPLRAHAHVAELRRTLELIAALEFPEKPATTKD
jgi:hypothetical protein